MEILINTTPNATIIDFDDWVENACPAAAKALIWETPNGPVAHADWTTQMTMDFGAAVKKIWEGTPLGLADLPANMLAKPDGTVADDGGPSPETALAPADAWSLFISLVAQSLVGEHLKWFPWSLNDGYSSDDLAVLFDSRRSFAYDPDVGGYRFNWLSHGSAIPAPPDMVYRFLQANGIVGKDKSGIAITDPLTSISHMLEWCCDNLQHAGTFDSDLTTLHEALSFWQYPGMMPVSRVLNGTTRAEGGSFGHYTTGCHGTGGMLQHVLRTINIPAAYITSVSHGQVRIRTAPNTSMYLDHCDDPYDRTFFQTPRLFDGKTYLIDAATYQNWFIDTPIDAQAPAPGHNREENLGRRNCELAIGYLPNQLLQDYCTDKANNHAYDPAHPAAAEGGQVFAYFKINGYTVGELAAAPNNLWSRMDATLAKLAASSGVDPCTNQAVSLPVGLMAQIVGTPAPAASPASAAQLHLAPVAVAPHPAGAAIVAHSAASVSPAPTGQSPPTLPPATVPHLPGSRVLPPRGPRIIR